MVIEYERQRVIIMSLAAALKNLEETEEKMREKGIPENVHLSDFLSFKEGELTCQEAQKIDRERLREVFFEGKVYRDENDERAELIQSSIKHMVRCKNPECEVYGVLYHSVGYVEVEDILKRFGVAINRFCGEPH